jgi:hypothetical protein
MQADGEMRMGEAASAASWALSRANGFGILGYLVYFVVYFAVLMGVINLAERLLPPMWSGLLILPLILVTAVGGIYGMTRMRLWRMSRTQVARGGVALTPVSYRLDEDALEVRQPHALTRVEWPGVSELMSLKQHWVFVVSGMGYCLPRRFFADVAAERAFIRAALGRLSGEARSRSAKAAAFVQWE